VRIRLGNRDFDVDEPRRGGLRWAVGSHESPRSSTWRFWGNKKGDFYLSTRSMGGVFKTSFHRDGNCLAGFTREYLAAGREKGKSIPKRFLDEWKVDMSSQTRAFQILIPSAELRVFTTRNESQMKWLPSTPTGYGTTVSLFTAPKLIDECWPGAQFGSEPIGLIATKSRVAWLVAKAHPIESGTEKELAAYRSQVQSGFLLDRSARAAIESQTDKSGIRVLVSGNRPDGERFCVEFAWDGMEHAA
jgi:hypothetical protein